MTETERKIQILGSVIMYLAIRRHQIQGGFEGFPDAALDCGVGTPDLPRIKSSAAEFARENGVALEPTPLRSEMAGVVLARLHDAMTFTKFEALNRLVKGFRDNFYDDPEFGARICAYSNFVSFAHDLPSELETRELRRELAVNWQAGVIPWGNNEGIQYAEPQEILAIGEGLRNGRLAADETGESLLRRVREDGTPSRWLDRLESR